MVKKTTAVGCLGVIVILAVILVITFGGTYNSSQCVGPANPDRLGSG